MPLVTGVDFVCVPTADFAAAAAFYEGTLGLERAATWGDMPAAEFLAGPVTLAVMDVRAFGGEHRPNATAIALRVDDVEAARAELEAKGVVFGGETVDSGVCLQAYFRDPDGNPLILHRRYAPPPTR